MYRLYDVQCLRCGRVSEALIACRRGKLPQAQVWEPCPQCGRVRRHARLLSPPAPYMGEKVYNPHVSGGAFDTLGQEAVPALPDLPPGVESNSDNYRQLFASQEWIETRAEVREVNRKNAQKRKRAAAIARGDNINMRRDKCDGDPHITG